MDAISGDETLPADAPGGAMGPLPVVDRAHYEILSEHARGGLGRILRARDLRTGRLVAIKEMLHDATDAAARFQREAMITANLQHPAIVPVYELGQWGNGDPFYAMKLVAGRSLDKVIADARTLGDRLAMLPRLIDVADAMAYAHGEGVIHRDLKPANVLVGAYGETVVIDWGLAKRRGDADADATAHLATTGGDMTVAGAVMGTPVYMPPEQARGEHVDARADVYALGAMLYHLLSGRLPYGESRSADEVLAKVRAGPPRPLVELEAGVPADLLAIVAKAMAPARDARYATARDLAEDLRRFQTGQLVGAHAYSAWQLLRRWLRRYRAAVGVAALLVAALAITAIVAVRRITAERNVAQRERADADRQRALVEARNNHLILSQARGDVATDPTRALAWLKQLPAGAPEWAEARRIASDAREQGVARWVLRTERTADDVVFLPDGRTLVSAGTDGKIRLWDLVTGEARVLDEPTPIEYLEATSDGAGLITIGPWYANASVGRRIASWDLAAGTSRVVPAVDGERDADALLSPDGRSLAVIGCAGAVRIVELATLTARQLRGAAASPQPLCANAMAFSDDGTTLAAETVDSAVDLFEVSDGRLLRTLDTTAGGTVRQIEFTADGGRVMVQTGVELVSWAVATGDRTVVVSSREPVLGFAMNGDASRLAVAGLDHTIRAWTAADGAYRVIASHPTDLSAILLAPDELRVVSASDDGTVIVSHLDEHVTRTLRGHTGEITEAVMSQDGAWIASSSGDGTIRVWSTSGARQTWDSSAEWVTQLVRDPDGGSVVLSAFDGSVERWTLAGERTELRPRREMEMHPNPLVRSADGRVLAVGRVEGGIVVWARDEAPRVLAAGTVLAGAAMSEDGARLAWVTPTGDVELASLPGGASKRIASPGLEARKWRSVALTADALVWAEAGGALGVHDLAKDQTRRLAGASGELLRIVIAADGRTAYALSVTGSVVRWDLASGTSSTLYQHAVDPDIVGQLELSPDATHLASVAGDHAVRITDLATGRGEAISGHTAEVNTLAFSPDGRTLASASDDLTVRLWDVAGGPGRVTSHHEEIYAAVFADDAHLVTTTGDGTISVVLDDVPRDEAGLRAFLADATNLVVDPEAP